MSLVCCSCRERGKARLDTGRRNLFVVNGFRLRQGAAGFKPGVSTVAGRAGGPARSSDEASVTEVERRCRVVCGCVCPVN
jgi:hypothetical protein